MTQRKRQAAGGVTDAGPRPAVGSDVACSSGLPATPNTNSPLWDEWFQNTSPQQRRELLALAARQGLVYAHQVPASSGNGHTRDARRSFLGQILAGKTDELEPLRTEPVAILDDALDAVQREAVAKAVQTPDLCLVQGLPGTGKTRVVAEIVAQAAARGERVLLLAATPAAVDCALERLAGRESILALRCLGRDERAELLPPIVRELTFAERVRRLREDPLQAARQDLQLQTERAAQLRLAAPLWPRLNELAERQDQLEDQLTAVQARRQHLTDELHREAAGATPLHARLEELRTQLRAKLAHLEAIATERGARMAEQDQERAKLAAQADATRPLAEARQQGRWWSPTWWRAWFQGIGATQMAEQEDRLELLRKSLRELETETHQLSEQKEQLERTCQVEAEQLLASATAQRRAELDDQEAALRQESNLVREKWTAACQELRPDDLLERESLQAAHTAWEQQVRQTDDRQTFARQWIDCLEANADSLTTRLCEYVNVVAATTAALREDPHFGEAAAPSLSFDLLVLEQADQLTESEFLQSARRARRWVLLGEPAPEETVRETTKGSGVRTRSGVLDPQALFFHRLWQHLHCDPRRLPYSWVHEQDRLCCRLRSVADEQRSYLEVEPVADRPDVELRILALPRTPPALAEVVFPAGMSISQAKEFIFHELAELTFQAERHSLRWVEKPEQLMLCLADAPAHGVVPVLLEHGVRELVMAHAAVNAGEHQSAGWRTCFVEFDRSAGWHRQRAEEWVHRHLGVRDPGRTVRLDVPYRMHPELAAFLSDWLFHGAYDPPPLAQELAALRGANGKPVVQFIPVPSLNASEPRGQRRRGESGARPSGTTTAIRTPKAGAGLELDAGDPRHRDRLPTELRNGYTGQGFVNFMEAQAVVRQLEALVASPAIQTAAQANPSCPVVGVLALYPAQAELIRRLMERVPALAASGVSIKVDVATAFREGECLVGLLSLTRSHSHRAVSFGEGPQALIRALTRARARLILFGDPGTLARRTQWAAAVDHLDDVASSWEHRIISGLVGYLHGQGAHSHRFQLCEGNCS